MTIRLQFVCTVFFFQAITFGQKLNFDGNSIDTIVIEASSGYYHFDKKGTTTGQSDFYVMAFDLTFNGYQILDYKRVIGISTYQPATSKETIKHFKLKEKAIETSILDGLLVALSTGYKQPTLENLNISNKRFLELTDENNIRQIAKTYKADWHFRRKYSTREENKIVFNGCQSKDTFNLFLRMHFDTSRYTMITDVWSEMNIHLKSKNKYFYFEGKYPNDCKQPWYYHTDTSKIVFPKRTLLNFDINKSLMQILPDDFITKRTIAIESLFGAYIKWYLQRQDIISKY